MVSLPHEAKVVVIGGGIAGCSTAYHLANYGWDTVLIERDVLTSGTTWHAAGMVTQLGTTPQITKIRKNSVKFYKIPFPGRVLGTEPPEPSGQR